MALVPVEGHGSACGYRSALSVDRPPDSPD
jgi:hypothetical protein